MPSAASALLTLLVCATASATASPQELDARLDARQRPHPVIESLRRVHGSPEELARVGLWVGDGPMRVSPFELASLLADGEPVVRLRAMAMLRLTLGLPLPAWLAEALRCDPSSSVRAQATCGPMTAAEVDWLITSLAAGEAAVPGQAIDTRRLSAKAVERLAAALIAAGSRQPLAPRVPMGPAGGAPGPSGPGGPGSPRREPPPMFTPRDGYAERCFAAAAALGPRYAAAVLATAVQATAPAAALRALHGFESAGARMIRVDAAVADAAAPLVLALLDHADPEVQLAAARGAWPLVVGAPVPALREKVVAMAQGALATTTLESDRSRDGWCGNGPPVQPSPTCIGAVVVGAASAAGDQRITTALMRRWRAPWRGEDPDFALLCLARLAPGMAPDVARELHRNLAASWSPNTDESYWAERPAVRAMNALFVAVPDDLLPWYRDVFADRRCRVACGHCLVDRHVPVPPDRLTLLLEPLATEDAAAVLDSAPELYLAAPERVAAAWRRGGEHARRAELVVSAWWRRDAAKVESLVAAGALPRAPAAAMVNSGSPVRPALCRLAAILPTASEASTSWISPFVFAIEHAPTGTHTDDVAALAVLADSPHPAIVLAAAHRAASLDAPATAIATRALSRLLPGADRASRKTIVRLCAATGVRPDDLESAVASLRGSVDWDARMLADAADLRFSGLHAAATKSGYAADAIGAARIDLDPRALHCALRGGEARDHELCRLLGSCSPVTMASGLELAADIRTWSVDLLRCVTRATIDDDPRVRRAAYAALRSRDRDVDPCALLVCEAAFDPDPSVRTACR